MLAVSADGPEIESLKAEGITHRVVPMTRKISPISDLVSLIRLIGVIRQFRPHIVHTHTPKAGLLGMMAAWFCRVPVRLHTVAGLPVMEKKGLVRSLLILTEKITYACATRVYPNAQGLQGYINENIPTPTPMKIIGKGSSNGINTVHFAPDEVLRREAAKLRRLYDIKDKEIVFSFIGRIVRDKGVNELLKAFDNISRKISCKLFLAGPFEDDLDPISTESKTIITDNKNVILLGYVDDVRPLLLASDVFVFPSYREGFPNVVMQACCMECPCIVTDINGSNEIISHGETGLVIQPKSVDALTEAMLHLAGSPDLRQTFAKRSRAYIVENFDEGYVWSELLREYEELVGLMG